ncbi:hypothetical protein DyAD56_18650 [Dyella sp. AD56]|nr:hypothetical protein DyAD56_18650 [Dyella sp. AD56]
MLTQIDALAACTGLWPATKSGNLRINISADLYDRSADALLFWRQLKRLLSLFGQRRRLLLTHALRLQYLLLLLSSQFYLLPRNVSESLVDRFGRVMEVNQAPGQPAARQCQRDNHPLNSLRHHSPPSPFRTEA